MERILSHPTGRFLLVRKEHFQPHCEVTLLVKMNIISINTMIVTCRHTHTLSPLSPICSVSVLPSFRYPSVVFLLLCPEGLGSSSLPPAPAPLQYLHPLFVWLQWLYLGKIPQYHFYIPAILPALLSRADHLYPGIRVRFRSHRFHSRM